MPVFMDLLIKNRNSIPVLLVFSFLLLFFISCAQQKERVYTIEPVTTPVIKRRVAVLPIYDNTDFSSRINALGMLYSNENMPFRNDISQFDNEIQELLYSYRINKASYYLLLNESQDDKTKKTISELEGVLEEQEQILRQAGIEDPNYLSNFGFNISGDNLARSYESPLSNAANAILTTNLLRSNIFVLLERQRIDDIIKEQEMIQSGFVPQSDSRSLGELLGAELLIMGNITNFTLERRQVSGEIPTGALLYLGIWAVTGEEPKSARDLIWHTDYLDVQNFRLRCNVELRAVDAVTGQILYVFSGDAQEGVTTVYISDIGGGVEYSDEMAFKVLEKAIIKAVYNMLQETLLQPFRGRITNITHDEIYINAGRSQNIKTGDRFMVYKEDSLIEDPATGTLLGFHSDSDCIIEVYEVNELFSKAIMIEECNIEQGDYIEFIEFPGL